MLVQKLLNVVRSIIDRIGGRQATKQMRAAWKAASELLEDSERENEALKAHNAELLCEIRQLRAWNNRHQHTVKRTAHLLHSLDSALVDLAAPLGMWVGEEAWRKAPSDTPEGEEPCHE